jgi:hypothetical protein
VRKELNEQHEEQRQRRHAEQDADSTHQTFARGTLLDALHVKPLKIVEQPVERDPLVPERALQSFFNDLEVLELEPLGFGETTFQFDRELRLRHDEAEQLFHRVRIAPRTRLDEQLLDLRVHIRRPRCWRRQEHHLERQVELIEKVASMFLLRILRNDRNYRAFLRRKVDG